MFLELLKRRVESYTEFYKVSKKPKLFTADYVFDENQSVKWNKQQVEVRNKELSDQHTSQKNIWIKNAEEINKAILEKIMEETKVDNLKCAQSLFNLANEYADDESIYVFNDYLNDLCDLVNMYMEGKE